ncbi:hypothetical protein ACHWQZ_G015837 [Mnemiopsis leidyi]
MQVFVSNEIWLRAIVYIEDALSYKSLCHKTDPLSLRIHRFVDFTVGTDERYELPFGVTHSVELLCILLFTADFIARCRISDKPPWKCKWLFAYGIVNFLYFIFFGVFIGLRMSQLRVYRVLRPFYMIQNSSIMKKMLNAVRRSLPEVLGVLVVLSLNVVIFGLSGHILFSDTIKIEGGTYFETIEESMWNFLVLTTTANNPDVMIPAYQENRLYFIIFIAYIWLGTYGLMNLLLAVIYNQFRQHFKVSVKDLVKRRNVALRAAFEVLTNPQIGRNRSSSHEKSLSDREVLSDSDDNLIIDDRELSEEATQPSNSCIEISAVISILDYIRMRRQYKKFLYKKLDDNRRIQTDHLDKQDFVKLFLDIETDCAAQAQQERRRGTLEIPFIKWIVTHPCFELVGTVLAFVNTVALLVVLSNKADKRGVHKGNEFVGIMNIIVTIYFVIEQVLRFLGVGPKVFIHTFSYCYDLVLTAVVAILMTIVYTRDIDIDRGDLLATNLLRSINLCICFRVIRVVLQVKRLRVVVKTYLTLIKHMQVYLGILIALMYVYAVVGMELFSSDVTPEIHNRSATQNNQSLAEQCGTYWNLEYYSLNFDDFFAAIVTLFTLMVVNNWHILVNAYSYSRKDWWSSYYFISWWIVCVLLILNVIIALILDAFIDRWERKDETTLEQGNFHVQQFVEPSERARAFSEKELITALHRNNIIRSPFININSSTPDLPSASHVNSQQIFCKT